MTKSRRRTIQFTGARAGEYPCTWGQRDMWREVERSGNPAHANVTWGGFLPAGHTPDAVLAALRDLVQRYESLRTRFFRAQDGQLTQRVLATGEIEVDVEEIESDPTALFWQWVADVVAEPYDLANGIPFCARVGVVADESRLIVFGMPHIAADYLGSRVFFDELLRMLDGRPAAEPAGLQPVEKAEWEQSTRGQRTLRRSLDYWRWAVDVTPNAAFDIKYEPEQPRYRRGCLTSRAVPDALDELAARYEVGTSHVLLAAMATLLGRYTGLSSCLMRLVVGNRGQPELRNAVGTLTQETVAVVNLREERFEEMVRAAWSSSLHAMRHGQYDPEPAAQLVSEAGAELDVYFNDMWTAIRGGKGYPGQLGDESSPKDAGTTFEWGRSNDRANVGFFLESQAVLEEDAAIELTLLADTASIPVSTIRTFLFAIEELLTALVTDDSMSLDELELVQDPGRELAVVPEPRLVPGGLG